MDDYKTSLRKTMAGWRDLKIYGGIGTPEYVQWIKENPRRHKINCFFRMIKYDYFRWVGRKTIHSFKVLCFLVYSLTVFYLGVKAG